jgi:hypothetical protein
MALPTSVDRRRLLPRTNLGLGVGRPAPPRKASGLVQARDNRAAALRAPGFPFERRSAPSSGLVPLRAVSTAAGQLCRMTRLRDRRAPSTSCLPQKRRSRSDQRPASPLCGSRQACHQPAQRSPRQPVPSGMRMYLRPIGWPAGGTNTSGSRAVRSTARAQPRGRARSRGRTGGSAKATPLARHRPSPGPTRRQVASSVPYRGGMTPPVRAAITWRCASTMSHVERYPGARRTTRQLSSSRRQRQRRRWSHHGPAPIGVPDVAATSRHGKRRDATRPRQRRRSPFSGRAIGTSPPPPPMTRGMATVSKPSGTRPDPVPISPDRHLGADARRARPTGSPRSDRPPHRSARVPATQTASSESGWAMSAPDTIAGIALPAPSVGG